MDLLFTVRKYSKAKLVLNVYGFKKLIQAIILLNYMSDMLHQHLIFYPFYLLSYGRKNIFLVKINGLQNRRFILTGNLLNHFIFLIAYVKKYIWKSTFSDFLFVLQIDASVKQCLLKEVNMPSFL